MASSGLKGKEFFGEAGKRWFASLSPAEREALRVEGLSLALSTREGQRALGRFDPQALTSTLAGPPYAYAHNNPVSLSDPTGLDTRQRNECGNHCGGAYAACKVAGLMGCVVTGPAYVECAASAVTACTCAYLVCLGKCIVQENNRCSKDPIPDGCGTDD